MYVDFVKLLPSKFYLVLLALLPFEANAEVCYLNSVVISQITPSSGDVGLTLNVSKQGCECDGPIWIDIDDDGGKSMYSAALAAFFSKVPVKAVIKDEAGQGASGNNSVTYVAWSTCQLMALKILN